MSNHRKKELQRAITELEKPYPKDDLINSYSDFIKVRDNLGYYQFNPVVFDAIVRIAHETWNTSKRISRLSLLQKIKHYYFQQVKKDYYSIITKPDHPLKAGTRILLFHLFRKTFEEQHYISPKQLDDARKLCNSMLINMELTAAEEEWLCSNVLVSEMILNRVLRYPAKSSVISNWAKSHFKNDHLRSRRAETLSWIIDQDPHFEIDEQTLIDDFEFLNHSDLKAIQTYDDEIAANKIIEQELSEYLPKKLEYDFFDSAYRKEKADLTQPELKLSKRPYAMVTDPTKEYPVSIPNFEIVREGFYQDLPTHEKITMIWAIGYSRLDNSVKFSLLKKYYTAETYYSMYKVCYRTKNTELLKWMLGQQ
jgi:hypothetical protein